MLLGTNRPCITLSTIRSLNYFIGCPWPDNGRLTVFRYVVFLVAEAVSELLPALVVMKHVSGYVVVLVDARRKRIDAGVEAVRPAQVVRSAEAGVAGALAAITPIVI